MSYPLHPYVLLFPEMDAEEYAALKADIAEHGQREPCTIHEGQIVDGRHRAKVCDELGLPVIVREWDGAGGLLEFVVSGNLHRRHLTKGQRGVVALKLVDLGQNSGEEAEALLGISPETIRIARRVQSDAPDLLSRVEAGEASLNRAEQAMHARLLAPELEERVFSGQVHGSNGVPVSRTVEAYAVVRDAASAEVAERLLEEGTLTRQVALATQASANVQGTRAEQAAVARRVLEGVPVLRAVHDHRRATTMAANQDRIANANFFDEVTAGETFPTVVIDPPWRWNDDNPDEDNQPGLPYGRGVPYATMTIPEILDWDVTGLCRRVSEGGRGVGDLGAENSHLWLWITNARLLEALPLFTAWGYTYKGCLTWVKPRFGVGTYFRGQTEHILLGVRGSQEFLNRSTGSWFAADRGAGGHSSKPDEAYELIERCSPGPWIDVFGRRHVRPGWKVIGVDSGNDPGSDEALAARDARRVWRLVAEVPEGAEVAEAGALVAG